MNSRRVHFLNHNAEGITKIAVLGGGLSGLTLGYLLAQKAVNFEVLEKNKTCGGLMRSLQTDGFTFDCAGSHVIFSRDEEALNFMLLLLGSNKTKIRRNTKVLYKGHFVKYPFENGLADLSKEENFECLYYFVRNLIAKEKGEITKPKNLREWCHYTFGRGIAEKYLIPYNEKIWKYSPARTSLKWVERIPNPPLADVIKSSLGLKTEGYTHQLYFYYPKKGGIQEITNRLEKKIQNSITTDFEIEKVRKEDNNWIITNAKEEKTCEKIISTIPIQSLIKAIDVPKQIEEASEKLKYNSLICVMIGLDTPKINDLSWLYIPDKNILSHRISFPSNYSRYVAPENKSSVLAEVTCLLGSEIWKMTDKAIIDRVEDDLASLKIINKKDVCFTEVKRTEYAYVINDLHQNENMQIIKNFTKQAGVELVGRFAEFEYLNMDGCIRSAIENTSEKRAT